MTALIDLSTGLQVCQTLLPSPHWERFWISLDVKNVYKLIRTFSQTGGQRWHHYSIYLTFAHLHWCTWWRAKFLSYPPIIFLWHFIEAVVNGEQLVSVVMTPLPLSPTSFLGNHKKKALFCWSVGASGSGWGHVDLPGHMEGPGDYLSYHWLLLPISDD